MLLVAYYKVQSVVLNVTVKIPKQHEETGYRYRLILSAGVWMNYIQHKYLPYKVDFLFGKN